jgi:hypothetical protein
MTESNTNRSKSDAEGDEQYGRHRPLQSKKEWRSVTLEIWPIAHALISFAMQSLQSMSGPISPSPGQLRDQKRFVKNWSRIGDGAQCDVTNRISHIASDY